jgi:hypothetical protein
VLPARDLVEIEVDTVGRRPSSAWRSMARASSSVLAMGFSANTGLPSSSALSAIGACKAGMVAMATASTAGSSTSARQSPYAFGTSAARASSAVRAALLPASAVTSQRRSARNAGSCTVRP